jgi:hypothetical protein
VDQGPNRRDSLVSATIYLEGGASGTDSKDLQIRCREGFRKLLEKCDYKGRMPRLFACGSRGAAFDDFKTALAGQRPSDFVAMWIDSEDPLTDVEATWVHLNRRDNWTRPVGATDDQVLLMTTCMETLVAADRAGLRDHYGAKLQASALPPLHQLENRPRHEVQDKLVHATRNCTNAYAKGKRSFEVLAELRPATLAEHLPSFVRTLRILDQRLYDHSPSGESSLIGRRILLFQCRLRRAPTRFPPQSADVGKSIPPMPVPEFEVAATCMPLLSLILRAWGLNGDEKPVGLPKWLEDSGHQVQRDHRAKAPEGIAPDPQYNAQAGDLLNQMLQELTAL